MEIHICSITEYDANTRVPTIVNPDSSTFYLVSTEDGTSPDLFTEWVYVNNAWEMFGSAKIDLSGYLTDVQINGTSIVQNGVANVPIASNSALGAVKANSTYGTTINIENGEINLFAATSNNTKAGTQNFRPIVPGHQHESTFYGLAKSAGDTTQSQSSNAVGNYTDNAKDSIQNMLGITPLIASHETDPFESAHVIGELFIIGGKLYRAKTALTAGEYVNEGTNVEVVSVAGVLNDTYVKNTDIASTNKLGLVKGAGPTFGININELGQLATVCATTANFKANNGNAYRPIASGYGKEAVFYYLAHASGDTTQSTSDNPIGTYTDEAKASIQTMLGVPSSDDVVNDVQINGSSIVSDGVANIPSASSSQMGVVFVNDGVYGIRHWNKTTPLLVISTANSGYIKAGSSQYKPITPSNQHESAFYGLAKVAGHDEKDSTLPVGTYTDEAKSAIKQMLSIADNYDSFIVDVEGTDPTITGQPSYRYNCGEVLSLTVTPPETGTIDFRFTSGSSPTVLTLPSTVKMPEWWVEVEANTIYEMCITDGIYCGVMTWAI